MANVKVRKISQTIVCKTTPGMEMGAAAATTAEKSQQWNFIF